MERNRANQITVGIFVFLGFLVSTYLVFMLGSKSGFFQSNITIYARFKDVKGLHPGSEVSLSGLRVGVVQDIAVAEDDSKEMVAALQIMSKAQKKIRTDSKASLKTQGVLGDKYIEISIGSSGAATLKDQDTIQTQETLDLFSKGGSLVDGLSKYLKQGGDVDSLIRNLARFSDNLVQLSNQVKREKSILNELFYGTSGKNLNQAIAHLDSIMKKIDSGDGTLGSIINDPTVYEEVKAVLGGAKRSSVLKYFMRQFMESTDQESKTDK